MTCDSSACRAVLHHLHCCRPFTALSPALSSLHRLGRDLKCAFYIFVLRQRNVKVTPALEKFMLRKNLVLGYIRARGIGRLVRVAELLQCHLAFAREVPIDEDFCRVRMRRLFRKRERATARREGPSFFPPTGVERFDRQSLILRLERAGTTETERKFPLAQPVDHLTRVATESNCLVAEKLFDELRAQFRIVVEKLHRATDLSLRSRIQGDNFAIPLGLQQIVVRSELLRIYQSR